jgi:hypothetical protein
MSNLKAYQRTLNNNLITKLNQLYKDKKSWWHKIIEDKDVFVLIRKDEIHAMVHGGLLLKISLNRAGQFVCKINEEFTFLKSTRDGYVDLTQGQNIRRSYIDSIEQFVSKFSKIKQRIHYLMSREIRSAHNISQNNKSVIDREIGLVEELKDKKRKTVKRVDFAAIHVKGKLVFFEIKLLDNKEIRSLKTPSVVKQLQIYEKLIERDNKKIIHLYNEQLQVYKQLEGAFFRNRNFNMGVKMVYPRVRLIITGFDSAQRKWYLPKVCRQIEKSIGWKQDPPDIIKVGNPKNIKEYHLFKRI